MIITLSKALRELEFNYYMMLPLSRWGNSRFFLRVKTLLVQVIGKQLTIAFAKGELMVPTAGKNTGSLRTERTPKTLCSPGAQLHPPDFHLLKSAYYVSANSSAISLYLAASLPVKH